MPRSNDHLTLAAVADTHDQAAAGAAPAARGRTSWSGLLRLSLVTIPVKAYAAVRSGNPSHFHLLHAGCGQRIQYHKHCPHHGTVEGDAIVRGYAYAPDQHVVVEPEELEQLRPARDKAGRGRQVVFVGKTGTFLRSLR